MQSSTSDATVSAEMPTGFVDLHTHLVPGVDDGAQSIEDSLQMLNQAFHSGTNMLAATPHVYPGVQKDSEIETLLQVRDQWIEWAGHEFPQVRVMAGAEIHCTHALHETLKRFNHRLSLNSGDYILLEFPFDMLFPGLDKLLFLLQQDGWVPVIAHPERNEVIQRNPEVFARMVSAGALTQVNAGSLLGWFGDAPRKSALQLLRRNLVHAVASDAHWPEARPADLSGANAMINDLDLGDADLLLRRNPALILQNQQVEHMPEPVPRKAAAGGFLSRLARHFQKE